MTPRSCSHVSPNWSLEFISLHKHHGESLHGIKWYAAFGSLEKMLSFLEDSCNGGVRQEQFHDGMTPRLQSPLGILSYVALKVNLDSYNGYCQDEWRLQMSGGKDS